MHRWYVLRTSTNYEKRVCSDLAQRLKNAGKERHVSELVVPTEVVTEIRGDRQVRVERKLLPGYVLFRGDLPMIVTQLRGVRGLQGFVGSADVPQAISDSEARRLLGRTTESSAAKPAPFASGDHVRITDGPLADFQAVVTELHHGGSQLTVMVEIFGRETRATVDVSQVRGARV